MKGMEDLDRVLVRERRRENGSGYTDGFPSPLVVMVAVWTTLDLHIERMYINNNIGLWGGYWIF